MTTSTIDNYAQHASGDLWFHKDTPEAVQTAIHAAYCQRNMPEGRIRVWYGDHTTGHAWQEEYDVVGRVKRSTGGLKVPLLIANERSLGGGSILTEHIVRIDSISDRRTLYKHPSFHTGLEKAVVNADNVVCLPSGEAIAGGFNSREKAQRWLDFMNGRRYAK